VWSSADGITWSAQPADAFAKTRPTQVLAFKDALLVVGASGSNEGDTTCPATAQAGVDLWRSTDGGSTWQALPRSPELANAAVSQIVVASDQLLAVGAVLGADEDRAATWTSIDGTTWTPAVQAPNAPSLVTAAAKGSVVVGFADDDEYPLAWISRDLGANWYEESIDLAGPTIEDVTMFVESVVATDSGFVAVGDGCCIGTGSLAPIVFASADGTEWVGTPQPSDHPEAMRRIVSIPGGVLAVGIETFVDVEADPSRLGGRSWLSTDGATWRRGPDLPELGNGNINALAAGSSGVVATGTNIIENETPAPSGDTGVRVWFAPFDTFAP